MEWFYEHPYRSALIGAGLLLALGVFIVERRLAAPVSNSSSAWGGANVQALDPSRPLNPVLTQQQQTLPSEGRDVPIITYTPPSQTDEETSTGFDFDTFVSQLAQPLSVSGNATTSQADADASALAYAFIPRGLISTSVTPKYTAAQSALYTYGNEVGSYIQSYEDRHHNDSVVLRDQAEDRTNPEKAAAVKAIGAGLKALGASLRSLEEDQVPQVMRASHAALADSYTEIGAKLSAIPDAESDQAFIAAIYAYNAAADVFMSKYLAVATLLSINGVTFTENDAGNVFTFTSGSSF